VDKNGMERYHLVDARNKPVPDPKTKQPIIGNTVDEVVSQAGSIGIT
jgi:hypothetical protein